MQFSRLPRHLAIIMDGNGRWAQNRSKPRVFGHIRGSSRVNDLIEEVNSLKISALTLYAFSTENWNRPNDEISILMKILKKWLLKKQKTMMENNIRFRAIGSVERLPAEVVRIIRETEQMSRFNTGLQFSLALSYGSREEILVTTRRLAIQVQRGEIKPEQIDEKLFSQSMENSELGDPDLLIRTSGELRVSNFMLWQIAYSEFYFTETLWPDFDCAELYKALKNYESRERRFGKVSKPMMPVTRA